jgi:hypothetical protein
MKIRANEKARVTIEATIVMQFEIEILSAEYLSNK